MAVLDFGRIYCKAFSTQFPLQMSSLHNGRIFEFWIDQGVESSNSFYWNLHFFRDLNDGEVEELLEMMEFLAYFSLFILWKIGRMVTR